MPTPMQSRLSLSRRVSCKRLIPACQLIGYPVDLFREVFVTEVRYSDRIYRRSAACHSNSNTSLPCSMSVISASPLLVFSYEFTLYMLSDTLIQRRYPKQQFLDTTDGLSTTKLNMKSVLPYQHLTVGQQMIREPLKRSMVSRRNIAADIFL